MLNHLVFSDPANEDARLLSADAMEQLGYQSESATWRNAYLSAAHELRHGSYFLGRARAPGVMDAMTATQLVDMLGVRFDPNRFRDEATIALRFTDHDETHLVGVMNSAINQRLEPPDELVQAADVVVDVTDQAVVDFGFAPETFDGLVESGAVRVVSGDEAVLREFVGALDQYVTARVIEPNDR